MVNIKTNILTCTVSKISEFITSVITAANTDVDSRSLNGRYKDNETQKKHTVGNKRLHLEFKIKQEKCRSVGVFIHTYFGPFAGTSEH